MLELIMMPFALAGVVGVIDVLFFQGRLGVSIAEALPFTRKDTTL